MTHDEFLDSLKREVTELEARLADARDAGDGDAAHELVMELNSAQDEVEYFSAHLTA